MPADPKQRANGYDSTLTLTFRSDAGVGIRSLTRDSAVTSLILDP